MKINKKEFLESELGLILQSVIDLLDYALDLNGNDFIIYMREWNVLKVAIKQFYNIEYYFTKTDEYYGVCTEDEDFLYRVDREL